MQSAVRARLKARLAGVPVDWNLSHPGTAEPRIVLWQIGGPGDYGLDGPTGYGRARVQVDCYGASYAGAVDLARQVKAALGGYRGGVILGAFVADQRDMTTDTGQGATVAGVSLDFMIHHSE
jgi:hypothetical protein